MSDYTLKIDITANDTAGGVFSKLSGEVNTLGGHLSGIGGHVGAVTTAIGVGLAGAATGAVGSIVGLGSSILTTGMNFQESLNRFQAVAGGSLKDVAGGMDAIKAKAIDIGVQFPLSSQDAADGLYALATAGFTAKQAIEASGGVAALAASQNMQMGTAAEIVAGTLNAFKMSADQSTEAVGILSATANASAVEVTDVAESMKYAGPVAGAFGYSMKDVSVAIGLMGNSMIKGSDAGTALREIMLRLDKPPKEAAAALKDLGINVSDAQGKMIPLSEVMQQLQGKFTHLTDAQKGQYAAAIAGTNAVGGFLAVVNSSPADFSKMTDAVNNGQGALDNYTKAMSQGLGYQVKQAQGSLEALQLTLYDKVGPALTNVAGKFVDFINTPGAKALVQEIGTDLGGAITMVVDGVTTLAEAFSGNWTDSDKIQPLHRVIGDLGLAIHFVIQKWQEWQPVIQPVIDAIIHLVSATNPLKMIFDVITGLMNGGLKGGFEAYTKNLQGAGQAVGNLVGTILNVIGQAAPKILAQLAAWGKEFIAWIGPQIPGILAALGQFIGQVFKWISDEVPIIAKAIGDWAAGFIAWIGPLIPPMLAEMGTLAGQLFSWILEQIPGIIGKLVEWGAAFIGWVATNVLPQLPGILGGIAAGLWNFITTTAGEIGPKIWAWAQQMFTFVTDHILPELPGHLLDVATAVFSWIASTAQDIIPKVGEWARSFFTFILEHVIPELPGHLADVWNSVTGWIGDTAPKLGLAILDFVPKFFAFVGDIIGKAGDMFKKIWDAIVTELGKMAQWMFDEAVKLGGKLIDGIISAITGAAGRIGDAIAGAVGSIKLPIPDIHIPGFATGGEVEGAYRGQPRLVIAHAGEKFAGMNGEYAGEIAKQFNHTGSGSSRGGETHNHYYNVVIAGNGDEYLTRKFEAYTKEQQKRVNRFK